MKQQLIHTSFAVLSEVDDAEAATGEFLDEVILLLDVSIVRVDEPAAAALARPVAAGHRGDAEAAP